MSARQLRLRAAPAARFSCRVRDVPSYDTLRCGMILLRSKEIAWMNNQSPAQRDTGEGLS